ncbi:tRNA 2-thiouridine(34) synthase MnmA, partial [Elusimicrobiota bacterium]
MTGKKIAVAVSGGVDSGVALMLLKEQGYDPIAVYCDHFECLMTDTQKACCSIDSLRRARETAEYLQVPFYRINLIKEFKEQITQPFIEYYQKGLTPNPCVWCNSRIRFSILTNKLRGMGYEYFATGHYAKTIGGRLFLAADILKDQTYFLNAVNRKVLEKVIFPLENKLKEETCSIARQKGLPVM